MISKELAAQASLAWHKWKVNHPGQSPTMSEEDFIQTFKDLQQHYNKGLIPRSEFDAKISELLLDPPAATSVSQFQPEQKSTDALMRELEQLKTAGVLNEEEFDERKAELLFQRGVKPVTEAPEDGNAQVADRKEKLAGYLEELLGEGVLTQVEFESAKARLGN